jgi:glycosyltransferase involved in cell wall biosynthesis
MGFTSIRRKDYKMKIAQIAPLFESVPPRTYGGTERVVSYLTEELVRLGHEVTLFARSDSVTSANFVPSIIESVRPNPVTDDYIPYYMIMLDKVRKMSSQFDILHFHIDAFHMPIFHDVNIKTLTTLHGQQDIPDLGPLYRAFPDMPLVSISNSQRELVPDANFIKTIYHGLPPNLLTPNYEPRGGYLAFLGSASHKKRPDRAIAIAKAIGLPIKIAAKLGKEDETYIREVFMPLINQPGVEYIGEINEQQKAKFLGEALALIFPIDWPEPFGLVMIEAMACGTPVLAFRQGSVPEVINDGVTGRIVDDVNQGILAVQEVIQLDRHAVRRRFDEHFSSLRMTNDYVEVYKKLHQNFDNSVIIQR